MGYPRKARENKRSHADLHPQPLSARTLHARNPNGLYDVESSEKSEKREESKLREEGSWFV